MRRWSPSRSPWPPASVLSGSMSKWTLRLRDPHHSGGVSAGSMMFGRQQSGDLSGIGGIPVEGHDIVAGIEIVGTKQLDLSRAGWVTLRERLQANGADLRSGFPLESQTLCRFKEVLRDLMSDKGFLDADITHETRPTFGNRHHLTIKFTIIEGARSRPGRTRNCYRPLNAA